MHMCVCGIMMYDVWHMMRTWANGTYQQKKTITLGNTKSDIPLFEPWKHDWCAVWKKGQCKCRHLVLVRGTIVSPAAQQGWVYLLNTNVVGSLDFFILNHCQEQLCHSSRITSVKLPKNDLGVYRLPIAVLTSIKVLSTSLKFHWNAEMQNFNWAYWSSSGSLRSNISASCSSRPSNPLPEVPEVTRQQRFSS